LVDALVFDFDGVVLDTETPDFLTWQEVFHEHGVELDRSLWTGLIGGAAGAFDLYAHLEGLAGTDVDRDAVRRKRRPRYLDLIEAEPVLPGVREYILEAKRTDLKLGLASSSSRDWVEGHLTSRGLVHHFDCIRGSDDVSRVKPEPELYLSVLDALGARAQSSIAIEDSPNGIAAAKAAGLFCVAVPNRMTKGLPLQRADLILDSLSDLTLEELAQIAGRAA
jgi:HAD superfamily hydrolase (TIGR01509 family)